MALNYNEREYLLKPFTCSSSSPGFSHNSNNKVSQNKTPKTILSIESNHVKRLPGNEHPNGIIPLLEYQLWLEAGKLSYLSAKVKEKNNISKDKNPSVNYDSNIWRNFRLSCGLDSNRKQNVSESVSNLYPISVPPPSNVGKNTLAKYFSENKRMFFKTNKSYELAIQKTQNDDSLMRFLSLRSEVRNPPLDFKGNIKPPNNFKKYPLLSLPNSFADMNQKAVTTTIVARSDAVKNPSGSATHLTLSLEGTEITKPQRKEFSGAKVIRQRCHDIHTDFDTNSVDAISRKVNLSKSLDSNRIINVA
jgi:hypothetical protein